MGATEDEITEVLHRLGVRVKARARVPVLSAVDRIFPPLGLGRPPRFPGQERGGVPDAEVLGADHEVGLVVLGDDHEPVVVLVR